MPGFIHRLFGRDDLQEKTKLDGGKNIKRSTVYHTRVITSGLAVQSCCKLNPFYFCIHGRGDMRGQMTLQVFTKGPPPPHS